METTRKTTTYLPEFRASAVKLVLESDQPTAQITKDLGVHPSTLYTWVNNYRSQNKKPAKNDDSLLEELKRLGQKNKRLKEEREILKKAAACFAKEVK